MRSNGAYGDRMVEVCRHARVPHAVYSEPYSDIPHVERIREMLDADPAITHVCMVHSETTTGLLNDIAPVGELCHERGLTFIVDAMSSFACVEMPVEDWHIDFLVSSANKDIQGVPGFSFIICRRDKLEASAGKARSLSMDLYDQWVPMERDGKWRYTSPTHVVLAFARALCELEEKGGIPARAMGVPVSCKKAKPPIPTKLDSYTQQQGAYNQQNNRRLSVQRFTPYSEHTNRHTNSGRANAERQTQREPISPNDSPQPRR